MILNIIIWIVNLLIIVHISICRSFQTFDTNQTVDPGTYGPSTAYTSYYDPNAYAAPDPIYDGGNSDFDNEPPLLEGILSFPLFTFLLSIQFPWKPYRLNKINLFTELGINPNHIFQKVSIFLWFPSANDEVPKYWNDFSKNCRHFLCWIHSEQPTKRFYKILISPVHWYFAWH